MPGGAAAEPIWEALVEVKVTRPADFLRALLARDSGRLAWFYDTIGTMTPERLAAAFGAPPIDAQIEEARAFYSAFRSADSNWKLEEHPFLRGTTDPWIVSSQIDVADGAVAPPAAQWFWEQLFDRSEITRRSAASVRPRAGVDGHARVAGAEDLGSVGARNGAIDSRWSASRRACSANVDGDRAVDALVALGGYRRYRAILLTLDRMEITTPRVYARARRGGAPARR